MVAANWESTWDDILNHGGNPRWKIDDLHIKEQALQRIVQYFHHNRRPVVAQDDGGGLDNDSDEDALSSRRSPLLHIFCPLAGDDPFVALAWQRGHTVTTIDLVAAAVASQRQQIGGNWTENIVTTPLGHHVTQWTHESGRAVLYVGDALQSIDDRLHGTVDAVYDKDAFGALEPIMRTAYCDRLAEYLKAGTGIVYTEVKLKNDDNPDRTIGPPYHVDKTDLMMAFGTERFDYVVNLGQVYEISAPPGCTQTGHILVRKQY
jgi:hypothetical protein